jgi:hypothetical protein
MLAMTTHRHPPHYCREKIRSKYHKLVRKRYYRSANPLRAIEDKRRRCVNSVDTSSSDSGIDPALVLLAQKLSSCNLSESPSSSTSLVVYNQPVPATPALTLSGELKDRDALVASPVETVLTSNSLQFTPRAISIQGSKVASTTAPSDSHRQISTSIGDPKFVKNTNQKLLCQFTAGREEFSEALRNHTDVCLRIIEFSTKPIWCLTQYIVPLIKLSANDNSPNGIQCFDEMCALVCKLSGLIDKDRDITAALDTTILESLLEVNRHISVQSQIAFETILHILDDSEALFDMLESVTKTRLTEDYYNPELIPFRCMRAEYIKILFSSSLNSSFSAYFRLEKACGRELWNSLKKEPSTVVQNRYKEIFREFSESIGTDEQGEIKLETDDSGVRRKCALATGHIRSIFRGLERW